MSKKKWALVVLILMVVSNFLLFRYLPFISQFTTMKVTLTSDHSGEYQVFYSDDGIYSADQSVTAQYKNADETDTLEFSVRNMAYFRMDFGSEAATIEVEDISFVCAGKTMSLETALGRVDFDEDATAAIAKAAKGGITLAMSDVTADFEDRGYAIAVSISLEDGEGNDLAEAASMGNITVTLNLDEDMEIENSLVVYALDGEEESQIEADVDADSRAVTFDASTLGTFAVDNGAAMGSATVYVAIGIVIAGIAYFVVRGKKKK